VSGFLKMAFFGSLLFCPLLYIVGAVVCIWYRRLSQWLMLAMIGFWGQVVFSGFLTCSSLGARKVEASTDFDMTGMLIIGNLGVIVMTGLIVSGLAMAFADVRQQLRQLREMVDEPHPWKVTPLRKDSRQPRKDGRPDIQQ
jgi:hypothetical protein